MSVIGALFVVVVICLVIGVAILHFLPPKAMAVAKAKLKIPDRPSDDKMSNRINLMDQELQAVRQNQRKQAQTISVLENALSDRFAETVMLCPSCEDRAVVKGGYLCEDCRG